MANQRHVMIAMLVGVIGGAMLPPGVLPGFTTDKTPNEAAAPAKTHATKASAAKNQDDAKPQAAVSGDLTPRD